MMVDASEKQIQDQKVHIQVQQAPLKCPRCDSSNTKFCYYNNYSLSQPRHFCKACKRYWTRGGTLRNVPVGGGYRKHKRVKQSTSSPPSSGGGLDISSSTIPIPVVNPSSTVQSSHLMDINNDLFYSLLANNMTELNFPYSTREESTGYGSCGGLGFLTGGSGSVMSGLNPLLSSYPGTSNYTSNLHQQKMASINGFKDNAQMPYNYGAMGGFDDLQRMAKDVKMEGQGNLLDWNMNHTYTEEINSSDPWNSLATGVRFNPSII